VRVALVVEDVAAGDGGLRQVPDQDPLAQREIAESVRVHLHHRRVVYAFEKILAIDRRRRGRRA